MAILIATIAATQEETDFSKYHAERSVSSCEMILFTPYICCGRLVSINKELFAKEQFNE